MDAGYWLHRIYEILTRKETGVIALVAVVVGIVKAFAEIRKLRSDVQKSAGDIVLNQINARLKELELRDRVERRPEVMTGLDAIRDNSTALYNDLIKAYEPFLPNPPRRPTKADSRRNIAAVQQFARVQAYRPKIRDAALALKDIPPASAPAGAALAKVAEDAFNLLAKIEDQEKRCYLDLIEKDPLNAGLRNQITGWVEQIKELYDTLIFDIGRSRYGRGTADTAGLPAKT